MCCLFRGLGNFVSHPVSHYATGHQWLFGACRAEVNSLYERLFFENVLTELGESSEVIYLSVANAALAHLPYLVALDHQSRQAPPAGATNVLPCSLGGSSKGHF